MHAYQRAIPPIGMQLHAMSLHNTGPFCFHLGKCQSGIDLFTRSSMHTAFVPVLLIKFWHPVKYFSK